MVTTHLHEVSFAYRREKLFSQLDFSLTPGNIYGLLGVNGAGKTTLLKLIAGQLFCQAGSIETVGFNPLKRSVEMLQQLFYVPEEFSLPPFSGERYLATYKPFYPNFSPSAFGEHQKLFGLDLKKRLDQLSLGQKKKFLLAFGLATRTPLLLLDEPTNGLDIPSKSQFRRIVASALTEEQTFLISTHQVRDMENLIDPIIILHNGEIIFQSHLDEVAQQFTFSLEPRESSDEQLLYQEKVPGGFMVVRHRQEHQEETNVDLETLFNGVISGAQFAGGVR